MVYINEWLPNPVGADEDGEWVELWNNGANPVYLKGWFLKTASDKKFIFKDRKIEVNNYLTLKRSEIKLALQNQNGSLYLYDAAGQLIDSAGFLGSAPEGKSVSRFGKDFIFTNPTPGGANNAVAEASLINNIYPFSEPLNKRLGQSIFWELLIGTSLILTVFVIFVLKRNENFSKLFFGRN